MLGSIISQRNRSFLNEIAWIYHFWMKLPWIGLEWLGMAQITFLNEMKNVRATSSERTTPQSKPTMGPPKMSRPGPWSDPSKDHSAIETYDGPTLKASSKTVGWSFSLSDFERLHSSRFVQCRAKRLLRMWNRRWANPKCHLQDPGVILQGFAL